MAFGVHAENWAQMGFLARRHATFDAAMTQAKEISAQGGYPVGVFRLHSGRHLYKWDEAVAVANPDGSENFGPAAGIVPLGLRGPVDELDLDAEGLPDEPGILDPWAYDAAPSWLIGVGVVFGAASLAAGAWAFWQGLKASR